MSLQFWIKIILHEFSQVLLSTGALNIGKWLGSELNHHLRLSNDDFLSTNHTFIFLTLKDFQRCIYIYLYLSIYLSIYLYIYIYIYICIHIICIITATNSPEQIHLATSIDSLGGDINSREQVSHKIGSGSILSKHLCVKTKSQKPSNCSDSDEKDPKDVTFEPNITDMIADRETIKSVSISEEWKTIYEFFFKYLNGPEYCQKNAEETVNEVCTIGIIIKAESINDFLKANLIRDVYFGVFNKKCYKADLIRKYLRPYDKLRSLAVSGQVSSSVGASIWH